MAAAMNKIVGSILQSPFHRILSGRTALIRYTGRRSRRLIVTPVMYASHDDGIVILVGRPETKKWWLNFETDHDIDILLDRHWTAMSGRVVDGAHDPDTARCLFETYSARFPRTAKHVGSGHAGALTPVIVGCRVA